MARAGGHERDGPPDAFGGGPMQARRRARRPGGNGGGVPRPCARPAAAGSFGWYVARLDDLDGDGRPDLAVGAPFAKGAGEAKVGQVWALSSASGKALGHWQGTDPRGGFGEVLTAAGKG